MCSFIGAALHLTSRKVPCDAQLSDIIAAPKLSVFVAATVGSALSRSSTFRCSSSDRVLTLFETLYLLIVWSLFAWQQIPLVRIVRREEDATLDLGRYSAAKLT
eukprot:4068670-Amphidinium_carterae.1